MYIYLGLTKVKAAQLELSAIPGSGAVLSAGMVKGTKAHSCDPKQLGV